MIFEITIPGGKTVEVDADANDPYLKSLESRNYKVQRKLNVCTSCEG